MVKNSCIERPEECAGAVGQGNVPKPAITHSGKNVSGEILAAIVTALGMVKKLTKSDRNIPEGYAFTSIDSFLALINPICAETGLVILLDETHVADILTGTRSANEAWLRISYDITLAHVSGQMLGPFRRHVDVPRNGPQAFGAAQSYVLKQFFRAQFQIATGESDDPDFGERATCGNAFEQRVAIGKPASKAAQDQAAAIDASVAVHLTKRIVSARSGRELLAILGGLSDQCLAEGELTQARLTALRRIVGSAASLAALDKLEHHFSTDWPKICGVAQRRRNELIHAVDQTEKTVPVDVFAAPNDPTDRPPEVFIRSASGHPTQELSQTQITDDSDFGEIPYSEAAA